MALARRACSWEQGERVTLQGVISSQQCGRGWVTPNKLQTARQVGAEIDDSTGRVATPSPQANGPDRIGGTNPPRICKKRRFCYTVQALGAGAAARRLADVAELADAIDLGSIARKGVEVRVLSSALYRPLGGSWGPWPSGKASPLQGEDRRFESDRVHFLGQGNAAPGQVNSKRGQYMRA